MRSASGAATVTTSPLVHVHEAVSRTVVFEFALSPGEKEATPRSVSFTPEPTIVAAAGLPIESTAPAIAREQKTLTAVIVEPELSTVFTAMGALGVVGALAVEGRK